MERGIMSSILSDKKMLTWKENEKYYSPGSSAHIQSAAPPLNERGPFRPLNCSISDRGGTFTTFITRPSRPKQTSMSPSVGLLSTGASILSCWCQRTKLQNIKNEGNYLPISLR